MKYHALVICLLGLLWLTLLLLYRERARYRQVVAMNAELRRKATGLMDKCVWLSDFYKRQSDQCKTHCEAYTPPDKDGVWDVDLTQIEKI